MEGLEIALATALALALAAVVAAMLRARAAERRSRRLFEHLPQTAIVAFDERLRVRYAAGSALAQAGFGEERLEGRELGELISGPQGEALTAHCRAALRGETRSFEFRAPSGRRESWMRIVPVTEGSGHISGGVVIALEIGERRRAEADLSNRAIDIDAVTRATRELARTTEPEPARTAACEASRELAQAPVAALLEPAANGALVTTTVAGAELLGATLPAGARSAGRLSFARRQQGFVDLERDEGDIVDREFMRRAGIRSALWVPLVGDGDSVALLVIGWREPIGGVSLRLSTMVSLVAAEAAVAIARADTLGRLEHLARTDPLTGLPNRRFWEQRLPTELSRAWRESDPVCVAMLDLDHFKEFNDRRGHQSGDELLRDAAVAWRGALRPYDVLARWGGEEFGLILPGCNTDDAVALVERLRAQTPGGETCSAGVAEWIESEQPDELVGRADKALYRAKRAGRNRTVVA